MAEFVFNESLFSGNYPNYSKNYLHFAYVCNFSAATQSKILGSVRPIFSVFNGFFAILFSEVVVFVSQVQTHFSS